ncbi:ATP-dependent helicase [Agrobacterium rubi]|nr:ATP-dependent helicase [Agrobacterium rubi]NTF24499.1 ATP-dependent helicase [Agrobacterium rubi]
MSLNEQQKKAASHPSGDAIVLAGPGTGKTLTLVARHAYLRSRGVPADSIMVVTFTKEASEELKNKLSKSVGQGAWIGTFHSLCLRLLRKFNDEAGLRKNFKVLDPSAQKLLLASIGIVWDADDGDLTDMIGRWKDSLMSPDEADAEAARKNNTVMRIAAGHYKAYEEELERKGDLDFADLVMCATRLIEDSEKVRQFFAERLNHALVDEFQDVNRSQVEFLQAAAACGTTMWAVADDDQSLYAWRGGRVRYTVKFNEYFRGARGYVLSVNYRCDPVVIKAANALIANNSQRVPKKLVASRDHRNNVALRVRGFKTEREEAQWIAAAISKMKAAGADLQDIAVLFRTSSVTAVLQQELEAEGIPFRLAGAVGFWELPEIRAVSDMLVAIENGNAKTAFRFRGGPDLVETMKGSTPSEAASAVARLVGDQPPAGATAERAAAWSDGCDAAADLGRSFATASEFASHVEQMAAKASSSGAEGVDVSTIHASKGLEWKHVIVCGCEASLMPHAKSEDKEEERRLFYVAITRTQGSVDLCYSRQRFGRSQVPSPYLLEINPDRDPSIVWIGEEQPERTHEGIKAQGPRDETREFAQQPGKPKVYRRKGGGRSLIPPEDR